MPALLTLLCLPCAGASATMYLRWRRLLPAWIRVVAVELPGRGGRLGEAFVEDYDAMVALLCAEQAHELTGHYALFGHSMGALLAYGMAARLHALGRPLPQALLVSGTSAPSHRDPARLAAIDNDAALCADLRKQGGTPQAVFDNAEMLRMTLDVLGADYRLCRSHAYRPCAPLPCALHAFGGRDDDIAPGSLEAWAAFGDAGFTLDWFDGGHFFLRQQERALLDAVTRRLG